MDGKNTPELTIILPVYNEKDTIETVLHQWRNQLDRLKLNYRFLICEDGSTDGTQDLLDDLTGQYRLILNQKTQRRGYGQAVVDGIKQARSAYVLCIDADGQVDPADFRNFWRQKEKASVIKGMRIKRADIFLRKLFSRLFKVLFDCLFPSPLRDPSAPFVLFRRADLMAHLTKLAFLQEGFWWGFFAVCTRKKISCREIPIHHRKRLKGETRVYTIRKIFIIAWRNIQGLIRLKLV